MSEQHPIVSSPQRIMTRNRVSQITEAISKKPNKTLIKENRKKRGQQLAKILKDKQLERSQSGQSAKTPISPRSKSKKAGLMFPVHSILKKLKKRSPHWKLRVDSSVFLTGVIEYMTAEVLELAGNLTKEDDKKRITPRHLYLAVSSDQELEELLSKVTISSGGVTPNNIHSSLLVNRDVYYKKIAEDNRAKKQKVQGEAEPHNQSDQTPETNDSNSNNAPEATNPHENKRTNLKRKSVEEISPVDGNESADEATTSKRIKKATRKQIELTKSKAA